MKTHVIVYHLFIYKHIIKKRSIREGAFVITVTC